MIMGNATTQPSDTSILQVATLGGGCFWCTEAAFSELRGILKVESGYSGGHVKNPSYSQVCSGDTGHAEVVQVTFDPNLISFKELLQIFFTIHDPTTLNRQGADEGEQYRSIILYHNPEQKETAEETIKELEAKKLWRNPVVTQVVPFMEFFKAEDYHQEYFQRNSRAPYCQAVIAPKIIKLREHYREKLKNPA
jgi:peptide-methionine (S)-S-oxide reductase